MDFSKKWSLAAPAALVVLVGGPAFAEANDCEPWPGEHRPLPTTTDSDPFLARWSELRAEELRALAARWEDERPATAATLRAHAACLAPRAGGDPPSATIRTTRVGRPFPSRSAPPPGAPTYERPAPPTAVTTAPSAEGPETEVAVADTLNASAGSVESDVDGPSVESGRPAIGSAPETTPQDLEISETAPGEGAASGPAAGAIRVLGQRKDRPVERGQERPAEVPAARVTEAAEWTAATTPVPADEPRSVSAGVSIEQAPPPGPAVAIAESPGVLQPKRPDPRVGLGKPFPPPPREAELVHAPSANLTVGSHSDPTQLPDVSAPVPSSGPAAPSTVQPPTPTTQPDPDPTLGRIAPIDGSLGETTAPATPAGDARQALREALLAASERARVEQERIAREREAAAKRAAARRPVPTPSVPEEAVAPQVTGATPPVIVGPQAPNRPSVVGPQAPTVATVGQKAQTPTVVARREPSAAAPETEPSVLPVTPPVSSPPALSGRSGLDRVRAEVRQARFEAALEVATELRSNLTDEASAPILAELEVLAATAALALGRDDQAQIYFSSALEAAPDLTLDPQHHSPKVLKLFEQVRTTAVSP